MSPMDRFESSKLGPSQSSRRTFKKKLMGKVYLDSNKVKFTWNREGLFSFLRI
jgi:hypothetical protein